jgi:hypothetical protein
MNNFIKRKFSMYTKIAATLYILGGLSQLILWPILITSGQVPDLYTEFTYYMFHFTSEGVAAALAITTGIGLWLNQKWAKKVYFFTTGLIVTAGYIAAIFYLITPSADSNLLMFAILAISTSVNVLLLFQLFKTYFPGKEYRYIKLTLLFNGALTYALINVTGFMAQIINGNSYKAEYVGIIIFLIVAGIFVSRIAWKEFAIKVQA